MKTLGPDGLSLADLCRVCAERAVYLHIGVAARDIGMVPIRITIQMSRIKGEDVAAWSCDMDPKNPRLNYAMSMLLLRELDRYAPKRPSLTVL